MLVPRAPGGPAAAGRVSGESSGAARRQPPHRAKLVGHASADLTQPRILRTPACAVPRYRENRVSIMKQSRWRDAPVWRVCERTTKAAGRWLNHGRPNARRSSKRACGGFRLWEDLHATGLRRRVGKTPSPWLIAGLGLAVVLAGCAARSAGPASPLAGGAQGKTHFNNYCSACHQYDDQGMGAAPPLDASPWVTGPQDRLIRIVLHGVRGPMEIQGKTYNREMPGFGQILSDADVADLLTFVRERFGRSTQPVTAAAVSSIRAANKERSNYWSVEELLAEP